VKHISTKTTCLLLTLTLILSSSHDLFGDDIETIDGKKYSNVRVIETNPTGIHILHSVGATFIRFEDLPKEIQIRYNYDPSKAEEYKKAQEEKQKKLKLEAQAKKQAQERLRQEAIAKAEEQRQVLLKKNQSILDEINSNPTPYVTIKNMGCSKVMGGMSVVPLHNVIPVKGDYFDFAGNACYSPAFNNSAQKADDFIDNLKNAIAKNENILKSIPAEIAIKEKELSDIIQSIAALTQSNVDIRGNIYDEWGRLVGSFKGGSELGIQALDAISDLKRRGSGIVKQIKALQSGGIALKQSINEDYKILDTVSEKLSGYHKARQQASPIPAEAPPSKLNKDSNVEKLRLLKEMLDENLITDDEYNQKKQKILEGI